MRILPKEMECYSNQQELFLDILEALSEVDLSDPENMKQVQVELVNYYQTVPKEDQNPLLLECFRKLEPQEFI